MSNFLNSFWSGYHPDDFVVEVTVSASDTFTLPLKIGEVYNFTVDYGDGGGTKTVTAYDDADATNTYSSGGTYEIKMSGSLEVWDTQVSTAAHRLLITDIIQWGDVGLEAALFRYCDNLVCSASDFPIESDTDHHGQKFRDCDSLVSISTWDSWDLGGSCAGMFLNASLVNFDVSGADYTNTTSLDNFMQGTSFSTANYDALLIALDGHATLQTGVTLDVGTTQYSAGAAATARADLTTNWSWVFIDGGQV